MSLLFFRTNYGIVIPQGIHNMAKRVPGILEDAENGLPGIFRQLIQTLGEHLNQLDQQVDELGDQILAWHQDNENSRKLAEIPGIGPITALMATIGDAKEFRSGRELAAWMGLVPRQHSSGGKQVLLGISKRGDVYLRTLMIHGARSVIRVAPGRAGHEDSWLGKLMGRSSPNVVAVALANKHARVVWAILTQDRHYDADYKRAA